MKKETVLVFCAHNDDQILGAGGTLAKYAKDNKKIVTVIFSYGELSHFWLKKEVTIEMRKKETEKADRVLGCKDTIFLGLDDQKVGEQVATGDPRQKIIDIIKKNKPKKIFTHSMDDPHRDHKAVYNIVMEVLDEINYKGDVYTFAVWNPVKFRKRDEPRLVIDISDTFKTKVKAFKCHESQKVTLFSMVWGVYLKNFIYGLENGCKYAEVFTKVR